MTYYLLKYPITMERISKEVREAFADAALIDADSTQKLPYLHAVIEEGLRIFPPVSLALERVSPGASVDGHYVSASTSIPFHNNF